MPRKRKPAAKRTAKSAPSRKAPSKRASQSKPKPKPREYPKAQKHDKTYEGGRSTGVYNQPAKYDPSLSLNDPSHPLYSPYDESHYGEDFPGADLIAEGYYWPDGRPMTNREAAAWNRQLAVAAGLPYTGVDRYGTPSNNIPTEFAPASGHPSSVRMSVASDEYYVGAQDPYVNSRRMAELEWQVYGRRITPLGLPEWSGEVSTGAPDAGGQPAPRPHTNNPWLRPRREPRQSPWQLIIEELAGYMRPDIDITMLENLVARLRRSGGFGR